MNITVNINTDTISNISAIVSVIAMVITLWQALIARKSLKIENALFQDRKPKFAFNDILDSYALVDTSDSRVRLVFTLFVSNLSDKAMIVEKIYLRIIGENREVVVEPILHTGEFQKGTTIEESHAMTGKVLFEISRDLYKNLDIIKYAVVIKDNYDNIQEQSVIYVREELVNNAPETDNE